MGHFLLSCDSLSFCQSGIAPSFEVFMFLGPLSLMCSQFCQWAACWSSHIFPEVPISWCTSCFFPNTP